ncbi:presenilin enhancer 2 [Rhizopus microsporus var. microsporus]|uniref:Presenilin enhancer 2 n=2 Tax=Rhizopus microsporus TaxID=58291 RepID=A0A2G4SR87_RHIZD|nr:presenilin enhancer 2 [Rhizopus microsporus ATCC 52813]ORE06426.1 presenilin enhancer 2 [Rhizopus microsporus var. microsporus]PHZ11298.1 presenilin enhancer 2 [Rhizopus microsporus ATCC 52813]
MPRLEKMSFEEHVSISKKMFYGGFAFLPFLWLVNFMYFYKTSQLPNAPSELKKYIYLSLTGCITWFILLTTWYAIFVNKRIAWSTDVDGITVVIPKGV